MTLFKLTHKESGRTIVLRDESEEAGRMTCVLETGDPQWVDDDFVVCKMLMSSGRKEILCDTSE